MQDLDDPATRIDDDAVAAVARLAACLRGQDFRRLETLADEVLGMTRAGDRDALCAAAAECRAQADFHLSRYPSALRAFDDAIERWHELGDAVGEARSRLGHSALLATCGLTSESLDAAYAALALLDAASDFAVYVGALLAIARVQTTLRAWDDAGRLYARALSEVRARADERETSRVLVDLGYFYCERSRRARAMGDRGELRDLATRGMACNREALLYFRSTGQSKLEWVALLNLGEAQMDLGDLEAARATTEATLLSVRRSSAPSAYCEGEALLSLGQIAYAAADHRRALDELTRALAIARRHGMNELVMRSCELLTVVHEALGDFAAALGSHRKFFAMHVQILSEAAQLRASVLAAEREVVETRVAIAVERERSRALERDNFQLQRESLEDSMTGLPNHRAFQRAFEHLVVESADRDTEFFLALIDVDDFKNINDRHSHSTGDAVLKALATLLREECRHGELAARYGGEEFTLMLPACGPVDALSACERIRAAIAAHPWSGLADGLRVTVSIGLAAAGECRDKSLMFGLADRRLYAAKAAGKNRVVAYDG